MSLRMLTVREAAQATGLTQKAIRHHVARRTIPFRRISSKIIFTEPDLVGWLEALVGCSLEEALDRVRQRGTR